MDKDFHEIAVIVLAILTCDIIKWIYKTYVLRAWFALFYLLRKNAQNR